MQSVMLIRCQSCRSVFSLAAGLAKHCPCQLMLCEVVTSCLVSQFVSASCSNLPNTLCEKG